jgi:hypothetical protein
MKLMASIEGTSWRMVWPRIWKARASDIPRKGAHRNPPANTAVPGRASALRSMIAVSPVGVGTTGGTRMARLCRTAQREAQRVEADVFRERGQRPEEDEQRRHRERGPGLQHRARGVAPQAREHRVRR